MESEAIPGGERVNPDVVLILLDRLIEEVSSHDRPALVVALGARIAQLRAWLATGGGEHFPAEAKPAPDSARGPSRRGEAGSVTPGPPEAGEHR